MENYNNKKSLLMLIVLIIFFVSTNFAQENNSAEAKKQYVYKLKLIPKLLNETNWTVKENNIVGEHFNRLKELTEEGIVILAGRTLNSDESQFGIVIFEARNDVEAENFMNEDPAVKEEIMTAEVFPFHVALMRETR